MTKIGRPLKSRNRKTCHVPLNIYKEIIKVGKGDFQSGLYKTNKILCCFNNNGTESEKIKRQLLMQDCSVLMDHLLELYPTFYQHFNRFPNFFQHFLKSGEMNTVLLKQGRKEKSLDEIKEKKNHAKSNLRQTEKHS